MSPEPVGVPGDDRLEAALAVALERLEREGRISQGWLARSFPDCWGQVAELLSLDARAAGGRNPSSRLGPWRLRRLLGQGGMGTVFLAEPVEPALGLPAGTLVAVKVVHPHLLERAEALARLRREAEAGRRVRHPSVVAVHGTDTIETPEGSLHLLAMEYVEGRTLRERLDAEGPLPEPALRLVAAHTLEGLAAIHAAGIVHRDVKPDNLVEREHGRVCLVDLGLAFLADERARLSRTGQFLGSFSYAAPEQVAVGLAHPDARADLFALGVTLYELATGRLPWPDGAAVAAVDGPALGSCPIRFAAPGLSVALATLIDDLLERCPDRRPPSAMETLARLRTFPNALPGAIPGREVGGGGGEVGGGGVGGGGVGGGGGDLEPQLVPLLRAAGIGRGAAVVVAGAPFDIAQAAADRLEARALRSGYSVLVVDGARGPEGFAALVGPAGAASPASPAAPASPVGPSSGPEAPPPPAPPSSLPSSLPPSSSHFLDLDRFRLALHASLHRRPEAPPLLVRVTSLHRLDPAGLSLWWTCVDAALGRPLAVLGTSDGEGLPGLADGMRKRPHVRCVLPPSTAPVPDPLGLADDDLEVLRLLARHPDGIDAAAVAQALGRARWTVALALARLHAGGLGLSEHGGVYRLSSGAAARFAE